MPALRKLTARMSQLLSQWHGGEARSLEYTLYLVYVPSNPTSHSARL